MATPWVYGGRLAIVVRRSSRVVGASTLLSTFVPRTSFRSASTLPRTPLDGVQSTRSQEDAAGVADSADTGRLQHDASRRGAKTKRQAARNKTPPSLRQVAAEAQWSRTTLVKGTGRHRFIDPEAETKEVTASCAAEQYDLPKAKRLLRQHGYEADPEHTGLYPQVIHIRTPTHPAKDRETGQKKLEGPGDVFVFPSGSVVSWNVPEKIQKQLVHVILLPAAINPHMDTIELEDMEYLEDPSRTSSQVVGDAIILGTQARPEMADTEADAPTSPATDLVLAKIAFSSGLARSTKLAVLENLLSSYFETTKSIPTILSSGSKLRFTRSFILRKTGELLSIRAQLNLYSELTDAMPDLFWDSPSQLGLSDYYDEVGRALDVNARIRSLNEKMDYASEIASVLRERLSEKHSTGLEWLIIFLISVEVGFELLRLWREYIRDPTPVEEMLFQLLLLLKLKWGMDDPETVLKMLEDYPERE